MTQPVKIIMVEDDHGHAKLIEKNIRRANINNEIKHFDEGTAALFEHLRKLRLQLARDEGVAAYIIFTDRTLIAMARERPLGLDEMRAIEGVGERKLAQYGETFIEAIAAFRG